MLHPGCCYPKKGYQESYLTPCQLREVDSPPGLQDGLLIRGSQDRVCDLEKTGLGAVNPSALPYLLLHPQKLPIWHLCSPRQGQGYYFPSVHELQASDEH